MNGLTTAAATVSRYSSPTMTDPTAATDDDAETRTAPPETATTAPHALMVERSFVAQHFLTVPDPGPEGVPHSHQFTLELRFAGPELDEYGYLVDIDRVKAVLDDIEARYCDTLLNDLPAFEGLNPSVERFAAVIGDRVADALENPTPTRLTVRLWEDEEAWASHSRRLEE